MSSLRTLVALTAALALVLPATAMAATSGSFDDPIGDTLQYAPDLGATTISIGDDDTLVVDTRIVPRPPAGWGGCTHYVAGVCMPSNMNVTWYFDYSPSSGSVADGGADAKVVAVPSQGQTFWESDRWDAATGKFSAGAQPAGAEDPGGATWTLRLGDLGIPKPATLRVWVVSLYKSYNGLGELRNYSDTAGPGTVSVSGEPVAAGGAESKKCKQSIGKANALQRKIRKAKGRKGRAAHRRFVKLRAKRKLALMTAEQRCGAEVDTEPPPSSAPPGCHLVTKPVLQQDGTGIYAPWVIKPEVVVDCRQR